MNDFDAINTGMADASHFLNALLSHGGEVTIPQGEYRICSTLRVPSGTTVKAHPQAHFFLLPERKLQAHEYLLTNQHDRDGGDHDITIMGGIWDGGNTCAYNQKGDIFDLQGYSGTVMNFCGVTNLTLKSLIVANSETYNIRMARIDGFTIEDISFVSDVLGKNQDGLHFNGECHHGVVRRITALSKGQTNDDLIALNADDSMQRVENIGMIRGDITDITFEDLYAEDCHTIIRLLSVDHAIRNITLKNVYGGFRCYAINADGARYCRTPLFQEEEFPQGVGEIRNVRIENMTCRCTLDETNSTSANKAHPNPAIAWESLAYNVQLNHFRLLERGTKVNALQVRNVPGLQITADDTVITVPDKQPGIILEQAQNLKLNQI